ncbi:MAG: hypothetical protein ACOX2L_10890 [Anaerolineae bacterium]|nr:hypothetical protein [Chloroflexota bacterium]
MDWRSDFQTDERNISLEATLTRLGLAVQPPALEQLEAAALCYLACAAGMARHLLAVAREGAAGASQMGPVSEAAREDALTVHTSAADAVAALDVVLQRLLDGLSGEEAFRQAITAVRPTFHDISNLLVGINCFSETLLLDLPEGSHIHTVFRAVALAGAQASRLARERAAFQRLLDLRDAAGPAEWQERDGEMLERLIARWQEGEGAAGELSEVERTVLQTARQRTET